MIDVGPDQTREPGEDPRPGLLAPEQIDALVQGIHERTGGASTRAAASNLDLYQVNSTFYAALGGDDRRYLAARAIQFFTPGVPQVYNRLPAFDGDVQVGLDGSRLTLTRRGGAEPGATATLGVDLGTGAAAVGWCTGDGTSGRSADLLTEPPAVG